MSVLEHFDTAAAAGDQKAMKALRKSVIYREGRVLFFSIFS